MRRRQSRFLFNLSLLSAVAGGLIFESAGQEPAKAADAGNQAAATDRAYAELALDQGMPVASLRYFADDGIAFVPEATNGKQHWSSHPEFPGKLIWTPVFATAAGAGDLAYTTGPWELKNDSKASVFGNYVTIWRRQENGSWQIALDVGTENPQPREAPETLQIGPADSVLPNQEAARRKLLKAQRRLLESARRAGASALLSMAADEIRVFRDHASPAKALSAARLMLSSEHGKLTREFGGSGLSKSGDLSYTYGKYSEEKGNNMHRGIYLTIWRINLNGDWQLVLDLQKEVP